MKYKAVELSSGKFSVGAGRNKYFSAHVYDTKIEADQAALIMSAQWYTAQAYEAMSKANKNSIEHFGVDRMSYKVYDPLTQTSSDIGDYYC